ncbi:outer membrane protein assembly factor BamE (lipoprotein component of BamABCDE complex) [Endobacter medicaginis]|uniref:Outer membrane protein assembly factor BamE n=1 Tax=Endobacter medicaginis TaxID=1181271 RepID=A0A850NV68_9PROT|nr:outer membrane protein assembly factor BamE [Endobacter medicaginis]MBB3173463.1 outer membrane protein assembly factor BamE (lipoprotein component of BamABCDE complex) [Endobacter medicaginis]MCX5475502.1 outer membrane protein assembly factor BamE [Endobacter medicaginis]NVN30718.1 outer membrane protein assembly factor BamE [Endobacter medicaginis]
MRSSLAQTPARRRRLGWAAVIVPTLAIALNGCSLFAPIPTQRGLLFEQNDLANIQPGSSTQADVQQILGTPTTRATFDDNTWIYISEVTEPVVMGFPRIDQQRVIALSFAPSGTLQTMKLLTGKDAREVAMVSQTTPSPGSKASILQQLLGNVGRYNPASGLGGLGGLGSMGNNGYGHGGSGNSLP